jgi:hypothetical protein
VLPRTDPRGELVCRSRRMCVEYRVVVLASSGVAMRVRVACGWRSRRRLLVGRMSYTLSREDADGGVEWASVGDEGLECVPVQP